MFVTSVAFERVFHSNRRNSIRIDQKFVRGRLCTRLMQISSAFYLVFNQQAIRKRTRYAKSVNALGFENFTPINLKKYSLFELC
jgi:hypothetical protein